MLIPLQYSTRTLLTIVHYLYTNNFDVILCRIPSHVGIFGNVEADRAAKSALNLPDVTPYPLPNSDITPSIKKHLFIRWQLLWHNLTNNKLYNIYFNLPINIQYSETQLSRREQTLYNRLRIGHTYLTHSYLLKDEYPPICTL